MDVPQLSNVIQMSTVTTIGPSACEYGVDTKTTGCSTQLMKFPFRESEMNSREILGKRSTKKQRKGQETFH